MPSQTRRPFASTYESEIRGKCDEQLNAGVSMADTFQDAMVNWYESAERMGNFDGDEWVPGECSESESESGGVCVLRAVPARCGESAHLNSTRD